MYFHNKLYIVLFIAILVTACQTKTKKFKMIPNVYAFYSLDDKATMAADSLEVLNWLQKKSEALKNGNVQGNLFDANRRGGGPNGGEWNPAADIYLAINGARAPVELRIKETHFNQVIYRANGFQWLKLSRNDWIHAFDEIQPEDLEKIYSKSYIEKKNSGELSTPAALTVGEFFEIVIYIGGKEWRREAFHAVHAE